MFINERRFKDSGLAKKMNKEEREKIYKNFNFKYIIVIPSIVILIAILGSVTGNREGIFFTISRDVITILSFIYFLRNES